MQTVYKIFRSRKIVSYWSQYLHMSEGDTCVIKWHVTLTDADQLFHLVESFRFPSAFLFVRNFLVFCSEPRKRRLVVHLESLQKIYVCHNLFSGPKYAIFCNERHTCTLHIICHTFENFVENRDRKVIVGDLSKFNQFRKFKTMYNHLISDAIFAFAPVLVSVSEPLHHGRDVSNCHSFFFAIVTISPESLEISRG